MPRSWRISNSALRNGGAILFLTTRTRVSAPLGSSAALTRVIRFVSLPAGVQGVLGVDVGGDAAGLLGLGDGVEGERGLAAGLGAVDLDDAAAGQPPAAQGDVQPQRAGGNALDVLGGHLAHRHDRPLAELLL